MSDSAADADHERLLPQSSRTDESDAATVPFLPGLDHATASNARPFLRWAGGKTRLLNTILPFVPARFRSYHEPFVGSGAIFFAIRGRAQGSHFLADLNWELINAWQVVRDEPHELLNALSGFMGKDREWDYYAVRESDPEGTVARAARFFYLNQTAWNALWRVNRWGTFNVPWGARPFRGIANEDLITASRALRSVSIEVEDFRETLRRPRAGDLVYLDPPYLPISDTSKFSGYTERRFRRPDLAELASICRELTHRNVCWILSNRDNALVRELFSHSRIIRFTTCRSVAAQNRRDVESRHSPEVLVIGGSVS